MINHPLFNEDDDNEERASRDIGYINIRQFEGSRGVMLTGQWEPDELMTHDDVYNAVGVGHFELIGRHSRTKKIVDRVLITIKIPRAPGSPAEPEQRAAPRPQFEQQPAIPMPPAMQAGTISIPPGMDPQTVLMVLNQQAQMAQLQAQREDSRFHSESQTRLMIGLTQSMAQMTTGLAAALGGRAAPAESTGAGVVDGFLKGIEIMADLKAGMKEGEEAAEKPSDWGQITANIAEGIRNIAQVAKIANVVTPVDPIVPPGVPTP